MQSLTQCWVVVPGHGMWCREWRMCRSKPVWRWYPTQVDLQPIATTR